jgi:hypothetical protein
LQSNRHQERTFAISVLDNCVDGCEPRDSCEDVANVKKQSQRPRKVLHPNSADLSSLKTTIHQMFSDRSEVNLCEQ